MPSSWRSLQRENFTDIQKLCSYLELEESIQKQILSSPRFMLNLPLRLAKKIQKNTVHDPLFRQFIPLQEETKTKEGFSLDPVQDTTFCKSAKLLHKYQGRALLLISSACAMHCRYCFRQNFPYETTRIDFAEELSFIRDDSSIKEVILSGGDPLSLSNEKLQNLFLQLNSIPHIKRVRFHTRFPIGIPERIDDEFLSILEKTRLQVFFVIHVNHPNELDFDIFSALKKIQRLGIPLLSQSVLLKGVNDCPVTLETLFMTLSDEGVIPYYLHQLDKVSGTTHFTTTEEEGKELMRKLSRRLSGYSLPKYVKEEPGKPSKTIISYY